MVELISLEEAAAQGVEYVRMPGWSDPRDHFQLDVEGGTLGKSIYLWSPVNRKHHGENPVEIRTETCWPDRKLFLPYVGPEEDRGL